MNKLKYFEEYTQWKKGHIEKVIRKETMDFNYSCKKNHEELRHFFNDESLTIEELEILEKELERQEKIIFVEINENEKISFTRHLEDIKEIIEEKYDRIEKELTEYLKEKPEFKELAVNKNIICNFLFDSEYSLNEDKKKIDIYGYPYYYNQKYYFIDEKNKIIGQGEKKWRVHSEN